jgi:hypothetical protein
MRAGEEARARPVRQAEEGEEGEACAQGEWWRTEEGALMTTVALRVPGFRVFTVCAVIVVFAAGWLVCVGSADASFGIVPGSFRTTALNEDGTIDTQAGSHPYEYVVSLQFNTDREGNTEGNPRDVNVALPRGLVGDPTTIPRCDREEFEGFQPRCSGNTQIGILHANVSGVVYAVPLFNVVPPNGAPLTLGASLDGLNVLENTNVRTGGDYGVNVDTNNIPTPEVVSVKEIVWGVPAAAAHDPERQCPTVNRKLILGCASGIAPVPFLTLPTSCEAPLETQAKVDSVEEPTNVLGPFSAFSLDAGGNPTAQTGCERLPFEPGLTLAPDTSDADTPAGLTAEVKVDQAGLQAPEGLTEANIKDTTVTLPEGVAINPGQAAGLQACPLSLDGLTTESERAAGREDTGPPSCPNASKVGTVQIRTPLLQEELAGDVYVLPSNPPDLELLVSAEDPLDGIFVKLIGHVHLDAATGRITTTFEKTPELPFTTFKLSFSGGAQAALSTPLRCGVYTSNADFTPWSTPFDADLLSSNNFAITSGPGGGPCPPATLPFEPAMIAGSTTDQAGGYTDFSLLLTRPDDQQRISGLQFKTPKGLLGMISKVPLCPEAQANAGTCSPASQIGHTVVEAGPGPYPLVVPQPGQPSAPIYLTAGYEGAPYGLSIVVPLVVGPFTLQTQIVRAKIEVDPLTAQITVTTDPLPQIIDGVPADLRTINAVIDKPGFMFNPTDCTPGSFSGTATSDEGASTPISSHFQMGSCQSLTFKPNFKVSVSGKTSKADGASLTAKILYPTGALADNQASSQSNVAMVKVDLPKQLPSRLTTLQKACPAATFEANPAGCPVASIVGHATAITPVLPVPVTGPAYFVSYGGVKFPELVIVLQGYDVTVYLHGETFISKAGITSSTFRQVPDVPITSFVLTLPQGPFSALAANGNLCKSKLVMPTVFTGHNGATLNQNTHIEVTGCPNKISVSSESVSKKTLKLSVYVPAAGKLTVSGQGLSSASKTTGGRETLTVTLHQKKGGKLKSVIKLSFTPKTGKKQTKSVIVRFAK